MRLRVSRILARADAISPSRIPPFGRHLSRIDLTSLIVETTWLAATASAHVICFMRSKAPRRTTASTVSSSGLASK